MATEPTDLRDAQRETERAIFALERPDSKLMVYYALVSMILGPFFVFLLVPGYLRFRTLRYRFDDHGVSMRWGAFRRREINLSYGRIQDIHLTSNVVERWLGLARVQVQTASGSHKPEMVIEGMVDFEAVRSFLARRMRGAHEGDLTSGEASDVNDVVIESLAAATAELRRVRRILETRFPAPALEPVGAEPRVE